MSDYDYPIGRDAVLYANNGKQTESPKLWHVIDVYEPRSGGSAYVRLTCGTHTEYRWMHIDDVRDLFTPAGWSCKAKPTYIMTRQHGNEAYPKDHMTPELYDD
jgi:hypothetical protein